MIRKFIIKNFSPAMWNWSSKHKVASLQEFSVIERDSGNRFLSVLDLIPNPKLKAQIFPQVLEKFSHAEEFSDLAMQYSSTRLSKKIVPRECQIKRDSSQLEISEFYAQACAIQRRGHNKAAQDVLFELVKSNKFLFYWFILKSKYKINIQRMNSFIGVVGNLVLSGVLAVLYYVMGFFTHRSIELRFKEVSSDEIVKMIKEQQNEI